MSIARCGETGAPQGCTFLEVNADRASILSNLLELTVLGEDVMAGTSACDPCLPLNSVYKELSVLGKKKHCFHVAWKLGVFWTGQNPGPVADGPSRCKLM